MPSLFPPFAARRRGADELRVVQTGSRTGDRPQERPDVRGQQLRSGWGPAWLERRDGRQRRILLVHVPKTGGSSLRRMLADHVPDATTFLSTGKQEWAHASLAELDTYQAFTGHNFLEPIYLFPQDEWVTVLALREPLAWWRSTYKYQRRRATATGKDHPALHDSFDGWLASRPDAELSNPQAAWLAARLRVMFDNPMLDDDRIGDLAASLSHTPDALVDLLERLLERITVLGVTEDLHDVYVRMCAAMGWTPVHHAAIRDNVSEEPEELMRLSAGQQERLLRLNRIDTYLHARAQAQGGP